MFRGFYLPSLHSVSLCGMILQSIFCYLIQFSITIFVFSNLVSLLDFFPYYVKNTNVKPFRRQTITKRYIWMSLFKGFNSLLPFLFPFYLLTYWEVSWIHYHISANWPLCVHLQRKRPLFECFWPFDCTSCSS